MKKISISIILLAISAFSVCAEESSQKKNNWVFTSEKNSYLPAGSLFVIIKPAEAGEGWAIESLSEFAPEEILKNSKLEPFIVSADFQKWSNYYQDNIGNCDSFNVQDSPYKNTCSSQFSGKNNTKALIGLFFGGSGVAGHRYNNELVAKAINSIDPTEAEQKLVNIEKSRRNNVQDRKMQILLKSSPSY